MKGLTRNGINSDPNERKDIALFHLKATGEFDAAVREWEAKPAADKTWTNIKTFITAEYAKENKQNKLSAKHFKANAFFTTIVGFKSFKQHPITKVIMVTFDTLHFDFTK